jgi:hypothetical protein
MSDAPPTDGEELKVLLAKIEQLRAQYDALFACVAVLSIQAGNPPDLVNSLMKGVSDLRLKRNLGHLSDMNPGLATELLNLIQAPPPQNPDQKSS